MPSSWGRSKVVIKASPWAGINIHPRPGRRLRLDKGPDLPPSGGVDGIEHKYVRCRQCGFVNNTFVNQPGSGWGNEIAVTYIPYDDYEAGYDFSDINYDDMYHDVEVGAGCALCGSSEYQ
jgi:hypothetical protein